MDPNRLTPNEMKFYSRLLSGEVIPRDETTQQLVNRLRGKLGHGAIETRPGEGYIIGPDDSVSVHPETWKVIKGKEF